MGARQKLEIAKGIDSVIDLLAKNGVQIGILINEVRLMRRDFKEHAACQQALVKEWKNLDLEHHYTDNKATMAAIEVIKENGNGRKVEPV